MSRKADLARLAHLSQMMLDHRLARLTAAAAAVAKSEAMLRGLVAGAAPDLGPVAASEVGMRYERWADARRADINLTLARQRVAVFEARKGAADAFGRADVLGKLSGR